MNGLDGMKKKFRWLMAAAFVMIIGAVGTYVQFPAFAETVQGGIGTAVTMDVTYGYGEAARGDRYIPVRVELENQLEEEFKGTLDILTLESSMDIYSYQQPITIGKRQKVKKEFNIPLGVKSDQLYVTLKDEQGTEVIKKRLKISINYDTAEMMVGVLSDNPDGLQYLDGVSINYGNLKTRLLPLNQDIFPDNALALDLFDVLLISDFRSDHLSDSQQSALDEWVNGGGVLLIGTGIHGKDTLGAFADPLLDQPITDARTQTVNLGVEYASKAPGDAFLELPCVDVSLYEGNEVMSSDQITLLSAVSRGRGKIAVAAYDFADIADFCKVQPSYVEKIMTAVLGEDQIQEMSQVDYYGYSSQYWSVQDLINTGSVDRLPDMALYTIVILLYVIMVGPGLYFLLRKKGHRQYYFKCALLLSVCFTGIIYVMGFKTRFQSTFFTYATILDVSEDTVGEQTYINVRNPNNTPYSVEIAPEYTVRPVTRSYYYDMTTIPKFTGGEPYQVALKRESDRTVLDIRDSVAFTPKMFSLNKKNQNKEGYGFTGDLTLFGGKISGTITNHFPYQVEDAALLLYGKVIILGDLQPGETRDVSDLKVLSYPLSYSYMVAQMVSGNDRFEKVDIGDKEYVVSQDRANLLSFYLGNFFSFYTPSARVVGFGPGDNDHKFIASGEYEAEGVTMVTSELDVDNRADGLVYRSGSIRTPNLISGNYQASYNVMYGLDPVVLEYSLGNDLDVETVELEFVSPEFTQNQKYGNLVSFTGKMYFYNYDSRHYDLMDMGKLSYSGQELSDYLSPSNTMTVKYVYEGGDNYQWDVTLPILSVVGREK